MSRFRDALTGLFISQRAALRKHPSKVVKEARVSVRSYIAGEVTITGPAGERWVVHADGRIEGFPAGSYLMNTLRIGSEP